jgi:HEAT repeat protein
MRRLRHGLGLLALLCLLGACGRDTPSDTSAPAPPWTPSRFEARVLAARGGPALRALADEAVGAGPRVVPDLVAWLGHDARDVREVAAHALGDLAPEDPTVVPALRARLEDPDDYVRWKVVRALGRQGARALACLPALRAIAAAARETEVVRASAERAVAEIEAATTGR